MCVNVRASFQNEISVCGTNCHEMTDSIKCKQMRREVTWILCWHKGWLVLHTGRWLDDAFKVSWNETLHFSLNLKEEKDQKVMAQHNCKLSWQGWPLRDQISGERYISRSHNLISFVEISFHTTVNGYFVCVLIVLSAVRFRRWTGTQLAFYPTGEFSAAGPGGSGGAANLN